jgi:hypothetical protein
LLQVEVGSNFPKQWRELADLQQSALLKVCEMRNDPKRVKEICPRLSELAKRAVAAAAMALKRQKKMSHSEGWDAAQPAGGHGRGIAPKRVASA